MAIGIFFICLYCDIYKHIYIFLTLAGLRGKISCVWDLRLWTQEYHFPCWCDNCASGRIKRVIRL